MTTQAEIDDILNSDDSQYIQNRLKMSKSKTQSKSIKQESQQQQKYDDEFQEYEETKKFNATTSYKSDFHAQSREQQQLYKNQAQKQNKIKIEQDNQEMIQQIYGSNVSVSVPKTQYSQSKQKPYVKKLQIIKQQPVAKQDLNKKKKQSKIEVKNQKQPVQKKNLPYNFSKLKDIQKEHLLMDLIQQKNTIKQQNNSLKQQIKLLKAKYNAVLQEKISPVDNSREKVLIKQNQVLKERIESLLNLKKINDAKNSFKNLSKTQNQQPISIQPQTNERQQDLIKIIDKLKNRLKQSENQIKVLQQKMNDGLDLQQALKKKLRIIQKLEYKMSKLNEHAQNDRLLIQQLKIKIQQTQKNLAQQKQKNSKLEKQFRRIQLVAKTNNDIVKQLDETRKQKNNLQKSLRELTSNLVSKVTEKNKIASKNLPNMGYIEVLDLDSLK